MVPDPELARLLERLHPSELALRDWVAPQLDSSMIEEIAAADYGHEVVKNRHGIEDLLDVSRLPDELPWFPEEVLALTRNSIVDASMSPAQVRRFHLSRLFSCLVLVRVTNAGGYPVGSLTPLVQSSVELGPDALEATGSYLAWCRLHEPGSWRNDSTARPFLTLSLIFVSALLPAGRDPELLPGLIGRFAEELSAAVEDECLAWSPRPIHDLFKRVALASSRRTWVALASRFADGPAEHAAQLAVLSQAIRSELVADAAELQSLLLQTSR